MANDARPTAFVTGASGFLGSELVRVLVARGYQVFGLARSVESTQHLRRAGAIAIRGDLLVPGQWQDEAAAHWVFHIPPGAPARARSWRQDERLAHTRVVMDRHLLDAVAAGATRRACVRRGLALLRSDRTASCYRGRGVSVTCPLALPGARTRSPPRLHHRRATDRHGLAWVRLW